MELVNMPNTDSPEVMERAVSLWLTSVIWDQRWRDVHPDTVEEAIVGLYDRVHRSVRKSHSGD